MAKPRGKSIPITPFRNIVIDLMHFSAKVPIVTLDRRMKLAPLLAARQRCSPRPMWTSVFIKAYSLIAARQPVLRRCYMSVPWARFYEHPKNIASVNISRRVGDEDVVMQAFIRSPENRSLLELDAIMRGYMEMPVEEFGSYRRVIRTSNLPWPIRRFVMWLTINWLGRRRCHNLGTFGITSVADRGAGILNLVPLLTSTLHYGLFDDEGCLDVRYAFDHRVLDGAPAADALAALEETLLGEILEEVKSMGRADVLPMPGNRVA
ncbi:MAG: hypothetical protein EXR98_16555 [Gemmataceae bacterium]|nr:hypothetical protein [Gemmataceae bacterium]